MKYNSVISRSIHRLEQKRIRYGAFPCFFLIALCFRIVLDLSLNRPALNLQLPFGVGLETLQLRERTSFEQVIKGKLDREIGIEGVKDVRFQVGDFGLQENSKSPTSPIARHGSDAETNIAEVVTKNLEPICNVKERRNEFCEINRNVRVDGKSASVFIVSSEMEMLADRNSSWTIRPYARKEDKSAMSDTRKWSVKPVSVFQEMPQCTQTHTVPAILFSTGGYTGNHFHEFADVVIPLYINSQQYDGEVQFLITDKRSWWNTKFKAVLKGLSKYEAINIDEDVVHCFPSTTVGLKRHPKDLTLDPSKYSYSIKDFRDFLRYTYTLETANAIRIQDGQRKKPRLLIISRRRTRSFTNTEEITKTARSLGYEVTVAEADKNMSKIAEVVNSSDVLMGVHGAGLTSILFLPENAILIQILPVGGFEWIAANYFREPSKYMNLKYLEYKISKEESILETEPQLNREQGWEDFKSNFLKRQNVKLDLHRFMATLLKALELLHQ